MSDPPYVQPEDRADWASSFKVKKNEDIVKGVEVGLHDAQQSLGLSVLFNLYGKEAERGFSDILLSFFFFLPDTIDFKLQQ